MKKTRSLLALLACLALLVSLCAVASAEETETVTSSVDFTILSEFANHQMNPNPANPDEVAADPVATKAKLEALGLIVPELIGWNEDPEQDGNNGWVLQNCIQIFLTPKDGFANAAYIQKLEAGEGKVFAANATLDINYWLGQDNQDWDPGYVAIDVSVDGENWTEVATDDTAKNYKEYDTAAYHSVTNLELPGTAGASTVYVKVVANRHGGQTAAGISASTINGTVKAAANQPVVTPDSSKPDSTNPKDGDTISVFVAMALVCAAGAVITTKKFRKEN